jgi:hypothetical protein
LARWPDDTTTRPNLPSAGEGDLAGEDVGDLVACPPAQLRFRGKVSPGVAIFPQDIGGKGWRREPFSVTIIATGGGTKILAFL